MHPWLQWPNRWGGGEGDRVPDAFHREIFAELPGKDRQGKKGNGRSDNLKFKAKKKHFTLGKNQEKVTLPPPSEKYSSYASA